MNLTQKLDAASVNRLNRALDKAVSMTGRGMKGLVKKISFYFAQSVVKETGPGKSKPSKLPKKYRLRPVEKMPDDEHWYVDKSTDFLFDAGNKIEGKRAKNLRKAKGIKFWDKKKNAFGFIPTKATTKYGATGRKAKIPHAGAAKAGWLGVMALMGKNTEKTTIGTKYSRFGFASDKNTAGSILANLVDYTRRRWPNAHRRALRKAGNRLVKGAEKQLQGAIKNV
jgi:hypothetical protein